MNLLEYKTLINRKPMHIATVNENNNPNLSVASDVLVIEANKIIISVNEMVNTPKNISINPNIVMTVFNENYEGLKIFGTAEYYTNGKYYKLCKDTFFKNGEVTPFGATKPKGAIVVIVNKVEEYK